MIELHIEPRTTKTWQRFQDENPPFSVALDGYVDGPPAFSPVGPHANFDHHRLVDRLSTRSTCMQVFLAVSMGLFDTFQKDGEPNAQLFVNDPDQDTSLAVWVLRNPDQCESLTINQHLARLLLGEDILDCTAGAFPVAGENLFMRQQAWIFEPYFNVRSVGVLPTLDTEAMRAVIDSVGERITAFVAGRGEAIELQTGYDRIGGGEGWEMIVEHGPHARTALFSAGVRAFVTVRESGDGVWTYTLGRMSPFVRFPIQELYRVLSEADNVKPGPDGWSGSNTIGGSPREGGSKIPPAELEKLINRVLAPPG